MADCGVSCFGDRWQSAVYQPAGVFGWGWGKVLSSGEFIFGVGVVLACSGDIYVE